MLLQRYSSAMRIPALFHLVHHQGLRVLHQVAFVIKVLIVKRNKLKIDMFIGHQPHPIRMLTILVGDKPF